MASVGVGLAMYCSLVGDIVQVVLQVFIIMVMVLVSTNSIVADVLRAGNHTFLELHM